MAIKSLRKPFNFAQWIDEHAHLLKPPVGNKLVFDHAGIVVQVVGGPNRRVDFHDDPVEEFFYQLKGDMILKLAEGGKIEDVRIREGDVFFYHPMFATRHNARCAALWDWWWRAQGAQMT